MTPIAATPTRADEVPLSAPYWTVSITTARKSILLPRQLIAASTDRNFTLPGDSGSLVFTIEGDVASPVGLLHGGFATMGGFRCGIVSDIAACLDFIRQRAGTAVSFVCDASETRCQSGSAVAASTSTCAVPPLTRGSS